MKCGIDVSTYQGKISWMEARASGIGFAMIKATQGRSETQSYRDFTDSKFSENITGAHYVGMECGVYHYLTAQDVSEAIHEAEYFLSVIEPYRACIDLYAAVDVESKYLPKDKKLLTQIVYAFCSRVESAGYDPIIYTNLDWLTNRLNDVSAYPLWLALWRSKNNVPSTEKYPNLRIWQYGSEVVAGIGGNVDSNLMIAEKPEPVQKENHIADDGKKVDAETPSSWAADAFSWAKDKGILLGDGDGKYRPHDALTREEACLIAKRLHDLTVTDTAAEILRRMKKMLGVD